MYIVSDNVLHKPHRYSLELYLYAWDVEINSAAFCLAYNEYFLT